MTDTPSGPIYPTDWHLVDVISGIEVRQLSDDTYQLRSLTHTITINEEGFDTYREGTSDSWNTWLEENNIQSVPRTDI